ncbi:contact-dependent growth inhibition system immunity protein [Streptomyces ossamyceticus]|uniref:contact-dependent growth inhibition system immunity protein n=1 Tax=Streptomyces ossamyceticus TaxID=249581 RepID=UPI003F4BECE8
MPDLGLPEAEIQRWLLLVADHIRRSVEEGEIPPPVRLPETHWEWHARFPELAQFLGGWFSQDMPDEFDSHDAAMDDYRTTTDPQLVARLAGELHELLALDLDEPDYALAAELGMEVDPPAPYTPSAWLAHVADRLTAPARTTDRPARTPSGDARRPLTTRGRARDHSRLTGRPAPSPPHPRPPSTYLVTLVTITS